MLKLARLAGICAALAALCSIGLCQQQVPDESFIKLQSVFTDIRDKLWESNDEYWHRGEFERCIATLRLIVQIDPHDTEAYTGAAWLMDSALRDNESEAFLLEGLSNNPDVYDIYLELGNFYYFSSRYDKAIVYYNAALTFDAPEFVRHQLAHAYEHTGCIGDSLDTWLECEAMDPNDQIPQIQIDRILQGGEMSHVPEAITRAKQERKREKGEWRN